MNQWRTAKPKFPLVLQIVIFLRGLSKRNNFHGSIDEIPARRTRFNKAAQIANEKFNIKVDVNHTQDFQINGQKLRVYRNSDDKNQKLIINFHGGGMMFYDLEAQDYNCRRICAMNNCVVVNADYRLSPENKFPAAHEDAQAVLNWVHENIEMLCGDKNKIITMGDSAGGNLAASLVFYARETKAITPLWGQILLYPWLDTNWDNHQSAIDYGDKNYILSRKDMDFFAEAYFAKPEDYTNPRANLFKQKSLKGLPSTLILTARFDPLCSEGLLYGQLLEAAGVKVKSINYDNAVHGFMSFLRAQFKADEPLYAIKDYLESL